MSTETSTLGRARLGFAEEADIDEFVDVLGRYERGEISSDDWRKFRLVRGTYGQRQDDVQMLRVKIPQGILSREQLIALADVAERYSRGFGHITTRQNVQLHFLKLANVEAVMRRLADAGLTTREACGNSVRNITACPYAGVSADEVFDVTPYAEALTRYLLRHPLSAILPRKFKIAFEGCRHDHAFASINDIGWWADIQERDGRPVRGFRVTVGGGTAIMCRSGAALFDFEPVEEMFNVAEAIVRVFHRLGDYEHKQRNRMKFLIKALGWERYAEAVRRTLDEVRAERGPGLPLEEEPEEAAPEWDRPAPPTVADLAARAASTVRGPGIVPRVAPALHVDSASFNDWIETNVQAQKQPGYAMVTARVPLGDLTAGQLYVLADLALAFGDGTVRTTPDQNLVFRWVPRDALRELHRHLAAAGLGDSNASTIADVTSCPGAESCRLAVTQSRGLGRTLTDFFDLRPDLVAIAPDAHVKMSGCPNGCGQHHVATIGFQGSIRKLGSRAVPQYFVLVGGATATSGATFGRVAAKIPARRIDQAVERLLTLYRDERHAGESAEAFFVRVDLAVVKGRLADLEQLSEADAREDDFIDLGETHAYRPEVLDGECSA
jgi:sulfite reductase beta subunit-like hemoprotein